MVHAITPDAMAWRMMLPNLAYLVAACVAIMAALALCWKQIDRMTPYSIWAELKHENMAVSLLISAMSLGVCVAMGLAVAAAIG